MLQQILSKIISGQAVCSFLRWVSRSVECIVRWFSGRNINLCRLLSHHSLGFRAGENRVDNSGDDRQEADLIWCSQLLGNSLIFQTFCIFCATVNHCFSFYSVLSVTASRLLVSNLCSCSTFDAIPSVLWSFCGRSVYPSVTDTHSAYIYIYMHICVSLFSFVTSLLLV